MVIIPIVSIDGTGSVGGQGIATVETRIPYSNQNSHQNLPAFYPDVTFFGNMSNLNITISGDYTDGWKRYFNNSLSWKECGSASGVCYTRPDARRIDVYIVRVSMESEVK
jgi:hypothetical protein